MNLEDTYNKHLKESLFHYYSAQELQSLYGYVPKQRDYTFGRCLHYFKDYDFINILELGTSRSFVDGKYPGACNSNITFWEPESLEKWDWSSGLFTKYFSDVLTEKSKKFKITTVDISPTSISISKVITASNSRHIEYITTSSEKAIAAYPSKSIDLLYLDTGNMDEATAQLHLREAKLIIEKRIVKDSGLILIDDVRNPFMLLNNITTDKLGKSKYALPYFIKNNYEILHDEYQVILKKIKNDT